MGGVAQLSEPDILRRGKAFHRRVQLDWSGEIEGAPVRVEHGVSLGLSPNSLGPGRKGRLDIFVSQMDDYVSVVEIKSTDWDLVRKSNWRKLASAHRRQVLRYVDKYLDQDCVSVCAGLIYPRSPSTPGLKDLIEQYLNDNALQVVWYDDK